MEVSKPTERQIEILRLYAEYGTAQEVADALFIDVTTARGHIECLRELSELHYASQLVRWAYENHWWEDRSDVLQK